MAKAWSITRHLFRVFGLILLALILVSGGAMWFEHSKVLDICATIHSGMPLSELESLLVSRSAKHVVRYTRQDGSKVLAILDPATIGEMACEISNNGQVVEKAQYR